MLDSLPGTIGDDLRAGDQCRRRACGLAPVQFVDVFPNTPDRKVDLFPAALDAIAPLGLYRLPAGPGDRDRYPLALISPASERTISLDARRAAAARRQAD